MTWYEIVFIIFILIVLVALTLLSVRRYYGTTGGGKITPVDEWVYAILIDSNSDISIDPLYIQDLPTASKVTKGSLTAVSVPTFDTSGYFTDKKDQIYGFPHGGDTWTIVKSEHGPLIVVKQYISPCNVKVSIKTKCNKKSVPACIKNMKSLVYGNSEFDYDSTFDKIRTLFNSSTMTPNNAVIFSNPPHGFDHNEVVTCDTWSVAVKLDGKPFIIVVLADGSGYLVMRKYIRQIFTKKTKGAPFVCIGELVDKTFFIFDVTRIAKRDISTEPFTTREKHIPEIINELSRSWPDTEIKSQNFIKVSSKTRKEWVDGITKVLKMRSEMTIKTDGLIFQPSDEPYNTNILSKWKPYTELTIDVLADQSGFLQAKDRQDCTRIEGLPQIKYDSPTIVELNLHTRKVQRERTDKDIPNAIRTVESTMRLYNMKTDVPDLLGETMSFMKAWHRLFERRNCYTQVRHGATILDIGSGTGRSRKNWVRGNYNVYAVEPNPEFYAGLQRKKPVKPGRFLKTLNAGGEDNLIDTFVPKNSVDAVIMIHSLTFFFDGDKLKQLITNITGALKPGGIYSFITLDGNLVAKRLTPSKPIDCVAFKMTMHSDKKTIGITMKHEESLVKEQTEYLTDLTKLDMELINAGFTGVQDMKVPETGYLDSDTMWFTSCLVHRVYKKM